MNQWRYTWVEAYPEAGVDAHLTTMASEGWHLVAVTHHEERDMGLTARYFHCFWRHE